MQAKGANAQTGYILLQESTELTEMAAEPAEGDLRGRRVKSLCERINGGTAAASFFTFASLLLSCFGTYTLFNCPHSERYPKGDCGARIMLGHGLTVLGLSTSYWVFFCRCCCLSKPKFDDWYK